MPKHRSLGVAILTVSDTRTLKEDTSGDYLAQSARGAGHDLRLRDVVSDDLGRIRERVSEWVALDEIDVVLLTGGTGFAARDVTPEAVSPLLERTIDGFGELFRSLSYAEIGSSTIQSRALAGVANHTLVFCIPGSTAACRLAWEKILVEQLDSTNEPCNFIHALRPMATGGR